MGFKTKFWIKVVASVVALLATPAYAESECPAESAVEIENITSTAVMVWNQRWAERERATRAGHEAAQDAVPGRFRSLSASIAPEISLEGEANEYLGAATIAIELGDRAEATRMAIGAEWSVVEAEFSIERWRYVDQVQDTYLIWRKHELERGHLENYLVEANAELEPIRAARDRQLISRLDLADLEAEVAWIGAELTEAKRRARLAKSRLEALLGVECELAPVPATHEEPRRNNPWTPLLSAVESFPEVQAFDLRRQALEAQARAHEAALPIVLDVGVGARSVDFKANFLGPVLALDFPFQKAEASDAELARARAVSQASAGEWAALRIRAELEAEVSNFEVLVDEYFELKERYVVPLEARVELMNKAFEASQVEIYRLIQARRELHEAEHKLILQRAEIDARRLKANAIQKLLQTSGNSGERP